MFCKVLQISGFRGLVTNLSNFSNKVRNKGLLSISAARRVHKGAEDVKDDNAPNYLDFEGKWPDDERNNFVQDMRIITNFLSEEEESQILIEVEPYLKRLRYEFDHWDDAIHGYRETERKHWYPHNRSVIERVREAAFQGEIMPFVHVLDLAEDGVIKPHVDSTRYCGTTIAGLSLLSDCVMRLVRTDEKKYQQSNAEEESYRNQPSINDSAEKNFFADILLKRRSLYIMSNTARYNFIHEILGNETSKFRGQPVRKTRRVSVICRNEP